MTFRQSLGRCLVRNVWALCILGCILAIGIMTDEKVSVYRPLPTGSPAAVMATCDTQETGYAPKAVIIQRPNEGAVIVKSQKAIDKAINEVVFDKDWNNVRVIAFCF